MALGVLEIGMIALGLFVVLAVSVICAVYLRAKKDAVRQDQVEIIAPSTSKSRQSIAKVRALRVNNHATGYTSFGHGTTAAPANGNNTMAGGDGLGGGNGGELRTPKGTMKSLQSLPASSDADKMAALLQMRAQCESEVTPQEPEWDEMSQSQSRATRRALRTATATPTPTAVPTRKSRAHLKPQIVFSDLDDDQDELLLEVDTQPLSSEFPGFGVDRDAGKSIFDHAGAPKADDGSSSEGFSEDSDFESDRSHTPTTLI
eukprot:m.152585 g.152585  ORF g.152585 m.152585 type:complete len:260 (-) comp23400_c0_seq1:383-1162(-)